MGNSNNNNSSSSSKSKSKSSGNSGRCPKGHGLTEHTPGQKFVCDECGEVRDAGTPFYGCRTCNYDKCLYCSLGKSKKNTTPTTTTTTNTTTSSSSTALTPYRPQPTSTYQPTYQQQPVYQTTYQQPVYQQPVYQQPIYQQPVYQQPTYQQPTYQQTTYQQTNTSRTPQKYLEIPTKNQSKKFELEDCLTEPTDANKNKVLQLLENLQPSGKTSLYEAIANGTTCAYVLALAFLRATAENNRGINFRIINIVLTDGEDTSKDSSENFQELGKLLRMLHGSELDLEDSCQTFLVGIGDENFRELKILSTVCGKYCTFQQVSDVKIEDLFEQLEVKIGIAQRIAVIATEEAALIAQKRELALQVQMNRYIVLFTIDHSGSMAGARWDRTKRGLRAFLDKLSEGDHFAVQLFNHETCWLKVG